MRCDVMQVHAILQLEICDLQADPFLSSRSKTGVDFWKVVHQERFPNLCSLALRLTSMFGSAYICERAFSTMKIVKSTFRSRITDKLLVELMRSATTTLEINFNELVQQYARPQSFH